MRSLAVLALAVVATGCGGRENSAAETAGSHLADVDTTCAPGVSCAADRFRPLRRCTHVSRGFRACTTFFERRDERTGIYRRVGDGWVDVTGGVGGEVGWWRRVIGAPNRRLVLAQWSGACEMQSTYLVAIPGGATRPIFRGVASTALGWDPRGRARILVPSEFWGARTKRITRAGIYLVDPETLAATLERAVPSRPSC